MERAFGVLKEKFHVLKIPCSYWSMKKMRTAMLACVALHNMAVNERDTLETMPEPIWKGRAISVRFASDRVLFLTDGEGTQPGTIYAACKLSAFLSDQAAHKELQDAARKCQ